MEMLARDKRISLLDLSACYKENELFEYSHRVCIHNNTFLIGPIVFYTQLSWKGFSGTNTLAYIAIPFVSFDENEVF